MKPAFGDVEPVVVGLAKHFVKRKYITEGTGWSEEGNICESFLSNKL